MSDYIENVLIKLRRKYSKDELVMSLEKIISNLQVELGKANAYIDELEEEKFSKSLKNGGLEWYNKYLKIKERFDKLDLEAKKDELYLMRSQENSKLHSELRKIRKENKDLVYKISQLENKKL